MDYCVIHDLFRAHYRLNFGDEACLIECERAVSLFVSHTAMSTHRCKIGLSMIFHDHTSGEFFLKTVLGYVQALKDQMLYRS